MEVLQQVSMVVEHPFHSGTHAEVLELEVRDYGDNVVWRGPVTEYHPKRCNGRNPVRIVATKIGIRYNCWADYRADWYEGE